MEIVEQNPYVDEVPIDSTITIIGIFDNNIRETILCRVIYPINGSSWLCECKVELLSTIKGRNPLPYGTRFNVTRTQIYRLQTAEERHISDQIMTQFIHNYVSNMTGSQLRQFKEMPLPEKLAMIEREYSKSRKYVR
jgi:hypothetical protein